MIAGVCISSGVALSLLPELTGLTNSARSTFAPYLQLVQIAIVSSPIFERAINS